MPRRHAVALFALLLIARAAVAEEEGVAMARLLDRVAPSIVSVKARLRTSLGAGGERDEREGVAEARGALVGPRGLIVLWNSHLSSARWLEAFGAEAHGGGGFQVQVNPVEFRVTLPGSDREHAAILVASDADLDIAFLQLDPPPAEPLPFVDFSAGGRGERGQRVLAVSRLGSAFDGAAYFESARLAGRIDKPREAWLLDGIVSSFGLPIFELSGRPVGILVTVLSRVPDGSGAEGGDFTAFAPSLRQRQENARLGAFVLPAERVRGLIGEAAKRAASMMAEETAAPPP
jgi:hypothetical protein